MTKEKLKIKFVGIDYWGRPIFKPVEKNYYLSDVNNLFNEGTSEQEIKEFYSQAKSLNDHITYHGRVIDTDPNGIPLKPELELV